MQRERESELHRDLREMRTAIDKFKDAVDQGKIAITDLPADSEGYARELFGVLRELDSRGVDAIFVEAIAEEGLGRTVMDRLRRAAS